MPAMDGTGPDQIWNPGAQSESPCELLVPNYISLHMLPPQVYVNWKLGLGARADSRARCSNMEMQAS